METLINVPGAMPTQTWRSTLEIQNMFPGSASLSRRIRLLQQGEEIIEIFTQSRQTSIFRFEAEPRQQCVPR
jgi:hypothetical protein